MSMRTLVFLLLLVIIPLVGCSQTGTKITLSPSSDSYIPTPNETKTRILLLSSSLKITKAEEGYGFTTKGYRIKPGEKVIVLEGKVRNDYGKEKYVLLVAKGYDSSGKEIARSYGKGAPGTAPWRGDYFKLAKGGEKGFGLIVKYDDEILTMRIFVWAYDRPVP